MDFENVNPAAVAGREVYLGREHVLERGTEGADVGDQRGGGRLSVHGAGRRERGKG